jgi:NAD(P)-dependent dehydrogenase (short-subunit alcohol dehydrogenase family)
LRQFFGPIGVLINNAAIENFCAFAEIRDDNWDRIVNTNLKGTYIVTQTVLPDMLALGWGRIVNISALGAQTGAPNMVHYTASKGAIVAMTRSLAIELGPKGITVNSVSPGFIDTPMARRAIDGGLFPVPYEQIIGSYPIPRLGQPDDIAAAYAFFASEDASYVTAQVLGVNGGAAV